MSEKIFYGGAYTIVLIFFLLIFWLKIHQDFELSKEAIHAGLIQRWENGRSEPIWVKP